MNFTLAMGNCCVHVKRTRNRMSLRKRRRKIVLLLVGLDNAGKTTAAKGLAGENTHGTVPTVGFSSLTVFHKGYSVVIYDLGGGPQIRGIWSQYFVDVHGVIFVVDASDSARIDETRTVLEELLMHEKLAGKPLLLLANKQDCEGALDEIDVVERLNLEKIVNRQRCPTLVETCSALNQNIEERRKPPLDPGIQNGFRWLLNVILKDFVEVDRRVEADTHAAQLQLEKEKEERKRRVEERRRAREEVEGTQIIRLRDDSPESLDGNIIHVKSLSVESGEPSLDIAHSNSKLNHLSDSHDSGYTFQNIDAEGDMVSLMTVQSRDSAVQSIVNNCHQGKNGKNVEGRIASPSLKGVIKENLKIESNHGGKKVLNFPKKSNKTAPAPTGILLGGRAEEQVGFTMGARHPARKLPPLTPPANHVKMFEANSMKQVRLLKSISLSLSEDDADDKNQLESHESNALMSHEGKLDVHTVTSYTNDVDALNNSHHNENGALTSHPSYIPPSVTVGELPSKPQSQDTKSIPKITNIPGSATSPSHTFSVPLP